MNINFGVTGTALKWLESYLRTRWFKVNVGKEYPNAINLEVSVPQCNSGGPVLYLCYASSMQKELPPNTAVDIYRYADDHNLGNKFKPSVPNAEREVISTLERSIYSIKSWMNKNCLKMNDGKTVFMIVGSKHQLKKCETESINVNGIHITPSSYIKFLGTWTDQQVSLKNTYPLNVTLQCSTCRDLKKYTMLDKNAA